MSSASIWLPYCGPAPDPAELLTRWNLDPFLLLALGVAAAILLRLSKGGARQRGLTGAVLALAAFLFVSPFCALTSALFSARAAHHLFLTAIMAPLFVAAWRDPPRVPGGVTPWVIVHALVFWSWHAPVAYSWALSRDFAYWLMQASLFLSAAAVWMTVRQAPVTHAIAALLATMVQMGLLGALITFASVPLYAPHLAGPFAWGLSPLEDQQLGGLLMWAPGAGLYLGAALALLARWFARERASVPAAR